MRVEVACIVLNHIGNFCSLRFTRQYYSAYFKKLMTLHQPEQHCHLCNSQYVHTPEGCFDTEGGVLNSSSDSVD